MARHRRPRGSLSELHDRGQTRLSGLGQIWVVPEPEREAERAVTVRLPGWLHDLQRAYVRREEGRRGD